MKETDKSEDIRDKFPYEDILYEEHPTSKKHPRQSMEARAGQFSPFAALTGYGENIKETERTTEEEQYLEEDKKEKLDEVLQILRQSPEKEQVAVTYFIKDTKKKGGSYSEKRGIYKRVDSYKGTFDFQDKTKIPIKDIVKIEILSTKEE